MGPAARSSPPDPRRCSGNGSQPVTGSSIDVELAIRQHLVGSTLEQFCISKWIAHLNFGGTSQVQLAIENALEQTTPDKRVFHFNLRDGARGSLALEELLGCRVVDLTISDGNVLTLGFDDGALLRVFRGDTSVDSCTVFWPGGYSVVFE